MRPPNRSTRKPSVRTKRRLLEAAAEIFAEHGYDGAKIRDISAQADANVAAINYHFEDKAQFFLAVVQYARTAAESATTSAGPAAERLQQFVQTRLRSLNDRRGWYERLLSRELLTPSSAHAVIQSEIEDLQAELRSIVRELIGALASQSEVEFTANSVLGLCAFYQHGGLGDQSPDLVTRVAEFARASITTRRQRLEAEA
ncbi:MAG: AcrR family transcriptional regulator [Rhodothermales bacterium]|jgi:AcrR family transcriptional regulator